MKEKGEAGKRQFQRVDETQCFNPVPCRAARFVPPLAGAMDLQKELVQ
jgi:hypothetical protein